MAKFSIVLIEKEYNNNRIDGTWIQGHCAGTLETAIKLAKETEKINGTNKYAVVEEITPGYDLRTGLIRLG